MIPISPTTYAGRSGSAGFSDLATPLELDAAIRGSDVLIINDPLSFPWEWFADHPIRCPIVLDVQACSASDIVALKPALTCLTESDRILGNPGVVRPLCHQLGLADAWSGTNLDVATFAATYGTSKRADVEQQWILDRLATDDDLVVHIVDSHDDRWNDRGFVHLVEQLSAELGGATMDTIWGIHPEPGVPVERVVLAFRKRKRR